MKHPTALITVKDLEFIPDLCADREGGKGEDDVAYWDEESNKKKDERDARMTYMAYVNLVSIKVDLEDATFMHGISLDATKDSIIEAMHAHLSERRDHVFYGIRIYTCANRASLISARQYDAYCKVFGLRKSVHPSEGRAVKGSRGRKTSVGRALIRIPL